MEQIGYSLINPQNVELQVWGNTPGIQAEAPNPIFLPNGDHVHAPAIGVSYSGYKLVARFFDENDDVDSVTSDGTSVVVRKSKPNVEKISNRQFFQKLAEDGLITESEALTSLREGTLPAILSDEVLELAAPQRFAAEMLFANSTISRTAPPVEKIIKAAFGWSQKDIDKFWRAASKV
jgi:hypothetical protein